MFDGTRRERAPIDTRKAGPTFVFCAGGGAVGTAGANTALSQGMSVVVMDTRPDCQACQSDNVDVTTLSAVDPERTDVIQFVVGDSVDGLLQLCRTRVPDLVIPAIGGHFAARVAVEYLSQRDTKIVPCPPLLDRMVRRFPEDELLSRDEANAVLVASMMPAGGTCETDCPQPRMCPVTGRYRRIPMHELIGSIVAEETDRSVVLTVGTLGSVGVIAGSDLLGMFRQLEGLGERDTFAIATSCKCHGIVNFLIAMSR